MSPDGSPAPLSAWRAAARAVQATGRATRLDVRRVVSRVGFPLRAPSRPQSVEPLPAKRRTGADFDTGWSRTPLARVARAVIVEGPLRAAVDALADPERVGLDRLADLQRMADRRDEPFPVVFAANHHSHVDAPLLLTSIPEPWRHRLVVGAAADYFFATRVTGAMSALALGAIPIDRAKVNRRSADLATSLIADGWSLLIFPEGGRSPDGWGQPFRGGAAFLSARTGAPVVPIHLEGTGAILGKGMKRPKLGHAVVNFGAPIWPEGRDARALGPLIEAAVAQLADESATDWWSARRRAARGETPALHGPSGPSWRRAWALGDRGPRKRASRERAWPRFD